MADNCQMMMIKLVASYPKILEAVIGAKGVSTKYTAKAVNTYVLGVSPTKDFHSRI